MSTLNRLKQLIETEPEPNTQDGYDFMTEEEADKMHDILADGVIARDPEGTMKRLAEFYSDIPKIMNAGVPIPDLVRYTMATFMMRLSMASMQDKMKKKRSARN
jgi:hypothetical protein